MNEMQIDPFPFRAEKNIEEVLAILRSRLPKSANVYNMANALKTSVSSCSPVFYSLKQASNVSKNDYWIVATYFRDDYGMRYAISAPEEPKINDFIKDAFANSQLINWNERHDFPCIDRKISPMIWEISVGIKGNSVRTMPTKVYVMSPEKATKLEITNMPSIELKRLDLDSGTDFFVQTWKYRMKNSDVAIRKLLTNNLSAGVYIDGKVVCGTNVNGCGLIGMLHTMEEHRHKGFASLCTTFLAKSVASIGSFPCSAVEVNNLASNNFQLKNGFEFSHFADFISHTPFTE